MITESMKEAKKTALGACAHFGYLCGTKKKTERIGKKINLTKGDFDDDPDRS